MTHNDYILGGSIGDSERLAKTRYCDLTFVHRLDARDLLWNIYKGYELHHEIAVIENMKNAELRTGTALISIYLSILARQLPPTVELYGFDIFDDQFLSKKLWLKNVKLSRLSFLSNPHASLVGQNDVFHHSMMASYLRDSNMSNNV
ncbi:hypothetical protein N7451_007842 [Penicillium sp. IBT 35674x]|nr:hypothetical protein N7451_007842 [Penicillium sp. IBT 35674x]